MGNINEVYNYCFADKFDIEDLNNRKLYLNDVVNEEVINSIVYHIMRYNMLDKGKAKSERKPIFLYINSPGGNVVDGYGLVDAITTSKTPVYTINQAMCASMAFIIYIAGHKRYSMPSSEFLIHDGSTFSYGSASKVQDRMRFESEQIEKMTKEFILNHTKISEETYDKNLRVEWYFLPGEAKELGVVDSIVGKDCTIEEII